MREVNIVFKSRSTLLNLLGQIRIYSLADLIILLVAMDTSSLQLIGVVFLHLGFLFYREYVHRHQYRVPFPKYLWIITTLIGIFFYKSFFVIGFLISSYLYVKKHSSSFSPYGPFFRGLQYYFLASGVIGFLNPISFLAGGLVLIRNFAGDIRDLTKDKEEKLNTLPMILGFKKGIKYIHLTALLLTTLVWLSLSGQPMIWLGLVYAIEIGTYNLTPRA